MKRTLKRSLIFVYIIVNVLCLVACRMSVRYDYLADYEIIETMPVRMPAEYEPSSMIIVCYPNMMPLGVYKTLAEDNRLLVLVNPDYDEDGTPVSYIDELAEYFEEYYDIDLDNVTFLDANIDTDFESWPRDFSPFFTARSILTSHFFPTRAA